METSKPTAHRRCVPGRAGLAGLAAALVVAACASTPTVSPNVATTFTVDVGHEDRDKAWQAEAFFPRALTVNVGDSITFTQATNEPHTVTFNPPSTFPDPFVEQPDHALQANPLVFQASPADGTSDLAAPVKRAVSFDGTGYVSSGFLGKPQDTFTVTFTNPGTWTAVCLFHAPTMKVTVIVNPRGTPRPMTEADYRAAAADQVRAAQARAADLLTSLRVPDPTTTSGGARSFVVWAGAGDALQGIDYERFIGGERLSIKAGDSVTFDLSRNRAKVLHTVTFPAGMELPGRFTQVTTADGGSGLTINPRVVMPSPTSPAPFDGKSFTSSGLLVTGGATPQTWTVTFPLPGTFPYRCLLHDAEGMVGTVIVRP